MRISDWSSDVCSSDLHGCSFRRPHQSCTDRSIARQELQDIWPDASLMQNAYRLGGDQGRFFGRFCQHAVASDQRCGNLADEDRERKIPRTDAHAEIWEESRGGEECVRM